MLRKGRWSRPVGVTPLLSGVTWKWQTMFFFLMSMYMKIKRSSARFFNQKPHLALWLLGQRFRYRVLKQRTNHKLDSWFGDRPWNNTSLELLKYNFVKIEKKSLEMLIYIPLVTHQSRLFVTFFNFFFGKIVSNINSFAFTWNKENSLFFRLRLFSCTLSAPGTFLLIPLPSKYLA